MKKHALMNKVLETSDALVYLDPRKDNVVVPTWFKKDKKLILQIGLNMARQILDLNIDENGFSGTLSFSGSLVFCHVPWDAVFAIVNLEGKGSMYPESVPSDVDEFNAMSSQPEPEQKPKTKKKLPPYLRVIK